MFLDPAFLWALLGLVLIGAEFLVPGLVVVFFGIGALVTAALAALVPGISASLVAQIVAWLGSTAIAFVALRRSLARVFRGKMISADDAAVVGKSAVVTERITAENPGRVRFEGTTWRAASYTETLEQGMTVDILKQDGLTLYVTRSISEPDYLAGPWDAADDEPPEEPGDRRD